MTSMELRILADKLLMIYVWLVWQVMYDRAGITIRMGHDCEAIYYTLVNKVPFCVRITSEQKASAWGRCMIEWHLSALQQWLPKRHWVSQALVGMQTSCHIITLSYVRCHTVVRLSTYTTTMQTGQPLVLERAQQYVCRMLVIVTTLALSRVATGSH